MRRWARLLGSTVLTLCASACQSDGGSPPEPRVERGPEVSGSQSDTSPPLREIPPAERKPGPRVIPVKPLPRKRPSPDAGPDD
jgi:hypothetical protein